nr:M15 family metallopeptidase [uncultured Actinotalea sp.]
MVAPPMPPQTYNGEVRNLVGAWGGFANGRIPLSAMCTASWASRHSFRCDADQALEAMNAAFRAAFGRDLAITSSYRTYEEQVALKATKPTLAATPGTSNHGWGLAVDLSGGVQTWGSPEHNWLRANANAFGWYHPAWAQYYGSLPEPWHWEYAGAVASGNLDQNRTLAAELLRGTSWNTAAEWTCLTRVWQAGGWDHGFVGPGAVRGIAGTDMARAFGSGWATSSSASAFLANPKLQIERGLAEITEWYGGACRAERGDPLTRFVQPSVSSSSVGLGQAVTVRAGTVGTVDWVLEVVDTRTAVVVQRSSGRADSTALAVRWETDNAQGRPVGPGPYRLRLSGLDAVDGEVVPPFTADVEVTGSQVPPTVAPVPLVGDLAFVPLTPARVLDTRPGGESLGPASRLDLRVAGAHGVPSDARAVALNITATVPSGVSHLRVWPAGRPMPTASVLNMDRGRQATAAGVAVGVGGEGRVSIYNDAGATHLVVDVTGYWTSARGTGAGFTPLAVASRVLDTRSSRPAPAPGAPRTVQVSGRDGVPGDAAAVVVNVVSVGSGGDGYVAVVPHGQPATTSTVNHLPGTDVANRATVAVAAGKIDVHAAGATGDVVVDVVGWYGPSGVSVFTPVQPVRVTDTRTDGGPLAEGGTRRLSVAGIAGLPDGANAVTATVTAFGQSAATTYLTAWPGSRAMPATSDLNTGRGRDQANMVLTPLGSWGTVDVYNNAGSTHFVMDVTGYFRDRS